MRKVACYLALLLSACASSSVSQRSAESNSIFTLGSLHGRMLTDLQYTLTDFVRALDGYQPDLILTEVRTEHPGPVEGSIDGGIEQSIVYAFGETKKINVVPVDWFDDAWMKSFLESNQKQTPALDAEVKPFNDRYMELVNGASFRELHEPATQALVRKMYTISERYGDTLFRRAGTLRSVKIFSGFSKV